jgi:hypothetical protein
VCDTGRNQTVVFRNISLYSVQRVNFPVLILNCNSEFRVPILNSISKFILFLSYKFVRASNTGRLNIKPKHAALLRHTNLPKVSVIDNDTFYVSRINVFFSCLKRNIPLC